MIIVSVLMITYNHENFIREAIDGVLMQKTDFPIELIIGEDCSTDSTRKIVEEYAEKYPKLIRILLPEENLGMSENFIETMQAARGKYIALCEGDDYWTDPYKLQKQVDFLEANEEYILVTHGYSIISNNIIVDVIDYKNHLDTDGQGFLFTSDFVLYNWVTQPLTVVFRSSVVSGISFNQYKYFRDIHLFYQMLKNGKGYCFGSVDGVYRLHTSGVDSVFSGYNRILLETKIYRDLYLGDRSDIQLRNRYLRQIESYIKGIKKETNLGVFSIILKKDYLIFMKNVFLDLGLKRGVRTLINTFKL